MLFDPLDISNEVAYQRWRTEKLQAYEDLLPAVPIEIQSPTASDDDVRLIRRACDAVNFCLYRVSQADSADKSYIRTLGRSLGLDRLDGNLCSDEDNISSIQVAGDGRKAGYIPYTDRQLTWHTDGYYNNESCTIRAMVLHCVRPAETGGENLLLDHEMAYIQLRDENPLYIKAFMQPDVLVIPPNIENGTEIRPAQAGPVFSLDSSSGRLHMRYSARTRNIEWKQDSLSQEAVSCMKQLLDANNPYVITYRMQAGEGIIANNILHNRTAFRDSEDVEQGRLLYRARYYDRVAGVAE